MNKKVLFAHFNCLGKTFFIVALLGICVFAFNLTPVFAERPNIIPNVESKTLRDEVLSTSAFVATRKFDQDLSSSRAIDAVLLLDSSGSMKKTDPHRLRDQGAKLFLQFLDEHDRVALFQFDSEVKEVLSFQYVTESKRPVIERAISETTDDGGYTDLHAAVYAAWELFKTKGRAQAKKCIILLSDGKMDPHPSKGSGAELINRLFKVELPGLERLGAELYTLSLSLEADRELLEKMAHSSNGLHWYTPSVDNIHLKFSDLFLSLKKPQVVSLNKGGFEIDGGVEEATFYVSHAESKKMVIVDPIGRQISNQHLPSEVRWYKSKLYDVITVKHPMPGAWIVRGIENPEGFATLMTDLQLQVSWPHTLVSVNDKMQIIARLIQKGEKALESGIRDITFYTLKIVNTETGQVVKSYSLNDKGQDGDENIEDGLYSRIIEFDEVGDYKAMIAVTSPTFTRQQVISFSVSSSNISLELVDGPNEGIFLANLTSKADELLQKKVQLVVSNSIGEKPQVYNFRKIDQGSYSLPFSAIVNPGSYHVYARVNGLDSANKNRSYKSEILTHYVKPKVESALPHQKEQLKQEPTVDRVTHSKESESREGEGAEVHPAELVTGIVCTFLSLLSVTAFGLFGVMRIKPSDLPKIKGDGEYELPEHLEEMLEELKSRSSENLRKPTDEELELRELLRDTNPVKDIEGESKGEDSALSASSDEEKWSLEGEEDGNASLDSVENDINEENQDVSVDATAEKQAEEKNIAEESSVPEDDTVADDNTVKEVEETAVGEEAAAPPPTEEENESKEPLSDDEAAALAAMMLDGQNTE